MSALAEEIRAAVRAEVEPLRAEVAALRGALAAKEQPATIDSAGACHAMALMKDGKPNLPALNQLLHRHADLRATTQRRGRRLIFDRVRLEAWIAAKRGPK